jgi:peptide/nickel transport system permease protein
MPAREDGSGPGAGGAGAVVALGPGGAQRPLTELPGEGTPRWRILSAFVHSRQAVVGVGLVVLIALFCFAGPLIYRTNQVTVNLNLATLRPSASHPLGTDGSGYDVLGRLMLSGQSSLELGLAVAIATTVIGTLWGAIAGLAGGFVDSAMMRLVDTFLAIPSLLLLLILVNLVTPNLLVIIALLTLLSWLTTARLVRGEVLTLRTREFVQAVKVMGGRGERIIVRHLVPNAIGVIIVSATFTVADAILTLSALSFLGLGLPPPQTDWGGMLSNGLSYLFDGYWWLVYPPAIALVLTVLAFNLIGDAIRDALDVRLQRF